VLARFSEPPAKGYQAVWHRFDNNTRDAQPIGAPTTGSGGRLQAPADLPRSDGTFIKVSLSALEPPHSAWTQPVQVFFRRTGGAWELVGVERMGMDG
jgi:hypothetical protein